MKRSFRAFETDTVVLALSDFTKLRISRTLLCGVQQGKQAKQVRKNSVDVTLLPQVRQ